MKNPLAGHADTGDGYGLLLMSAVLLVTLSTLITFCYPAVDTSDNLTVDELNQQYADFTGSNPSSESVWCLSGIYTAYGYDDNGDAYNGFGYTPDGWVYGTRIVNYTPSQYSDSTAYTATYYADEHVYKYSETSELINKHTEGDLYGSVVMDVNKKSSIFFTQNGRVEVGSSFYYQFNGYRYAFAPVSETVTTDSDGNRITIVPNTSSLSLIWYDYYGSDINGNNPGGSGLAGQLIISGSDSGLAYLTSAQIVSAFNADTSTSKFNMTFNGVDMNVYIRLDSNKIANGLTVEQCYNLGYWSVMVTSISVSADSVVSSDYEFNPFSVFDTMIHLLTFNTADYGLTGMAGTLASFIIVIPLMIGLIVLGLNNYLILILAGVYTIISAWSWGIF